MKRSEVNAIIQNSLDFFDKYQFKLPEWAYWGPSDWKGKAAICREIIENSLGWDITDFGSGDFSKSGLVLFTIRNGNISKADKVYCEKIMIADESQETPMHFHWKKTEDIINRGGGNLELEIYQGAESGELLQDEVKLSIDGVIRHVKPGEKLVLKPGQSVCLKPYVYHRFYGQPGHGKVLIGEVSTVNDDANDNRFYNPVGRFPEILEDEAPRHLLVSEYKKYV
jgi:D-lyxose ketol-isomerase